MTYTFNKLIFRFWFGLVLVALGFSLMFIPLPSDIYFVCVEGVCENPFFMRCEQDIVPCNESIFYAWTEFGNKNPYWSNFLTYVFGSLIVAFVYNHLNQPKEVESWT